MHFYNSLMCETWKFSSTFLQNISVKYLKISLNFYAVKSYTARKCTGMQHLSWNEEQHKSCTVMHTAKNDDKIHGNHHVLFLNTDL